MVDGSCILVIAAEGEAYHFGEFAGECVPDDRDNPDSSECDEGECNAVVAGDDAEVLGFVLNDSIHLGNVAGSFFDSNNVVVVDGEPEGSLGRHVNASASGNVVEYER